jgi:hypothetical protein
MSNVIGIMGAAQDPDKVLEKAIGAYDSVLVIGWDKDGVLDVRASLNLEQKDCLWLIEAFKRKMLSGDYSDD